MNLGDIDIAVPTVEGYFVSEKQARIAELISEYDHNLTLTWIPPERREPGDKPFAVVASPVGQKQYVVCYADECDERLLARIYGMDNERNNVMQSVDTHNQAVRALQRKKYEEEIAEAHEISQAILRSPKSTYKHNGVKYT